MVTFIRTYNTVRCFDCFEYDGIESSKLKPEVRCRGQGLIRSSTKHDVVTQESRADDTRIDDRHEEGKDEEGKGRKRKNKASVPTSDDAITRA